MSYNPSLWIASVKLSIQMNGASLPRIAFISHYFSFCDPFKKISEIFYPRVLFKYNTPINLYSFQAILFYSCKKVCMSSIHVKSYAASLLSLRSLRWFPWLPKFYFFSGESKFALLWNMVEFGQQLIVYHFCTVANSNHLLYKQIESVCEWKLDSCFYIS